MTKTLAQVCREHRSAALITEARIIRDYESGEERDDQALTLVREAMIMRTLGRLSHAEEHRVFSLLSFVMPPDALVEGELLPERREDKLHSEPEGEH